MTSLKENLETPKIGLEFKFGSEEKHIHFGFLGIERFYEKNQRYPKSYNSEDAKEVLSYSNEEVKKAESKLKLNEEIIKIMSFTYRGNIVPMVSNFN
jgi:hypothetical protein